MSIGKSNVYPRVVPRVDIIRQAAVSIILNIQARIRFSEQPRHFRRMYWDISSFELLIKHFDFATAKQSPARCVIYRAMQTFRH